MTLTEITIQKTALEAELAEKKREFEKYHDSMLKAIKDLKEKEAILTDGLDLDKIEAARKVIYVKGAPWAYNDDVHSSDQTIAALAIRDLAAGCPHLMEKYYGNKMYDGFYQRCDCSYYMGPTYGSIVDKIGLVNRNRKPTDEETEAAIYYLKVYNKISSLKLQ